MSLHKLYKALGPLNKILWSNEVDAELCKRNKPTTPVESAYLRYSVASGTGRLEAKQGIEQTPPTSQWVEALRSERLRRAEEKNPTLKILREGFEALKEVLHNEAEKQWLLDNLRSPIVAGQLWESLKSNDRVRIPGEPSLEDVDKYYTLLVCLAHESSLHELGEKLTGEQVKSASKGQSIAGVGPGGTEKMSKEARALAVLKDHPDWTNDQIAKVAGCNAKSLSRMKAFRTARAYLQKDKSGIPTGSKDAETGKIEGWDE